MHLNTSFFTDSVCYCFKHARVPLVSEYPGVKETVPPVASIIETYEVYPPPESA